MRKLITILQVVTITAATLLAPQAHAISSVHEIVKDQAAACGSAVADINHNPHKYVLLEQRERAFKIVTNSVRIFRELKDTLSSDKRQRPSREDLKALEQRAEECESAAAKVFAKLR
jgi:hypothetical protein